VFGYVLKKIDFIELSLKEINFKKNNFDIIDFVWNALDKWSC